MKKISVVLLVLCLVPFCAVAKKRVTAKTLYNQSLKASSEAEKLKLLKRSVKLSKKFAPAHNSIAIRYRNLGNYEKAKYHFTKAVKLKPKNYYYRANRCSLFTTMKEYNAALVDCQTTLALGPKRGYDYNALADVYQKMGKYDKAEKNFKLAIKKSPQKCFYHHNLGFNYYLSKEPEKAIESYDAALKLCKGYSKAYGNRAKALYDIEEYEQALKDFKRASQLEPDNVGYYKEKVKAYISLGECSDALEDITELLSRAEKDPDSYLSFALYWACSGSSERNNKKALKFIQNAADMGFSDFASLKSEEPYKTFFAHLRILPEYAAIEAPYSKKPSK